MGDEVSGHAEELTIGELLAEKDLFRLVIRGCALVDDIVNEGIRNAFGDRIPKS